MFPLADEMLSVVRHIISLYNGLSYPPTVSYIQCVDAGGQLCGKTIRSSLTLMITSPTAITDPMVERSCRKLSDWLGFWSLLVSSSIHCEPDPLKER
jgi:hypothetical protein